MIKTGALTIKQINEEAFIVHNKQTKRYHKLGFHEGNYLLSLLGLRMEAHSELTQIDLTDEQKTFLSQKFHEAYLLNGSEYHEKKSLDLSNFTLISFEKIPWFKNILNAFSKLVSTIGLGIILSTIFLIIYAVNYESNAILDGILTLNTNVLNVVTLLLLGFISAIVHETCHCAACYKYTGTVSPIGIKLYYFMPAYFSDVSSMYMVNDKYKSAIVAIAGVCANLILAGVGLLIYLVCYHFDCHINFLLYFSLLNLGFVVTNSLPVAKFDGYWLLKALTEIDNLYDKSVTLSFALIFNPHKYLKIKEQTSTLKIGMTVYGLVIYSCHWLIWAYGVYWIRKTISHYVDREVLMFVTAALCAAVLINCIHFSKKYYRLMKKST